MILHEENRYTTLRFVIFFFLMRVYKLIHHARMALSDLQWYSWSHNMIKMWKIQLFFRHEKCLFLWVSSLLLIKKKFASHFRRETANENKGFKETKHWFISHTLSDKAFQGNLIETKYIFGLESRKTLG